MCICTGMWEHFDIPALKKHVDQNPEFLKKTLQSTGQEQPRGTMHVLPLSKHHVRKT